MILGLAATTAALTGCATHTPPGEVADSPFRPAYVPAAAGALCFDPPIIAGQTMPDLSRDGRANEAFAGYETQVTTFSYVHQRDEQRVQGTWGQFQRDADNERTSTITR